MSPVRARAACSWASGPIGSGRPDAVVSAASTAATSSADKRLDGLQQPGADELDVWRDLRGVGDADTERQGRADLDVAGHIEERAVEHRAGQSVARPGVDAESEVGADAAHGGGGVQIAAG